MSPFRPCAIVGLGNPGENYRWTRHNAGKIFLDNLARDFNIPLTQRKDSILWGEGMVDGLRVFLSFPETYMNLSGRVVPWMKQKNIDLPERVLILSDDINLPSGTLRYREGGGAGGQKGLLSIIQAAGSDRIARIRVGVGSPPPGVDLSDYVLGQIPSSERESFVLAWKSFREMVDRWLLSMRKTSDGS
ncbi:MAG: aminoacyl-tRNA hydrolase [Leptospirillum sp.]